MDRSSLTKGACSDVALIFPVSTRCWLDADMPSPKNSGSSQLKVLLCNPGDPLRLTLFHLHEPCILACPFIVQGPHCPWNGSI